jgi:1-acyl-sn-glycerol-3-phosphate acyltransferase
VWPPHDGGFVYNCVHIFATTVKPLFCRLRVEGQHHMPRTGGCVLTCNHTMGPDFLAVGYAAPRQIYFMAKQELFDIHPALTWLFNHAGVFPIRRGETDWAAVEHALRLVAAGHVLGMFPEGTRSRTGRLQRGRSGAARVAIQAQAPVVPAYVAGAGPIFRRSNYLSLYARTQVTVRFGLPLYPPSDRQDTRALRNFTREIMQAISALGVGLEDSQEDPPEDPPSVSSGELSDVPYARADLAD